MQKLIIPKSLCSEHFCKFYLPKATSDLLIEELSKRANSYLLKYISSTFAIKPSILFTAIRSAMKSTFDNENYYISLNINYKCGTQYLSTIISIIDYGNRDIKGNYCYGKILNYICNNLQTIYHLYELQGGN